MTARDHLARHAAAWQETKQAADDQRERVRAYVLMAHRDEGVSEVELARIAGVTRMTIRAWLGK